MQTFSFTVVTLGRVKPAKPRPRDSPSDSFKYRARTFGHPSAQSLYRGMRSRWEEVEKLVPGSREPATWVLGTMWVATASRYSLALGLILGGAIGNLIDRILYHEVIDFIDFFVGRFHWPAFNIADSCITVGVILMFADLIRSRELPQIKSSSDTPEST